MALLAAAVVFGLVKLALGVASDEAPLIVNVAWAIYDLMMLSVVLDAVTYAPPAEDTPAEPSLPAGELTAAVAHGRVASGAR